MACVGISIAQSPGKYRRFSPTVYCLIVSASIVASFFAGWYIVRYDVARLRPAQPFGGPNDDVIKYPSKSRTVEYSTKEESTGPSLFPSRSRFSLSNTRAAQQSLSINTVNYESGQPEDGAPWEDSLLALLFPPWWRKSAVYILYYMIAACVTWWLQQSLIPFAAASTVGTGCSKDSVEKSANFLQWVTWIQDVCGLLGSAASILARPGRFFLRTTLFLMVLCLMPVVFAAVGVGDWTTTAMKSFLMIGAAGIRITYGWFIPLMFREVALKHPTLAEPMGRNVALWNQMLSVPCLLVVYYLTKS